jgi:hypothetical protein
MRCGWTEALWEVMLTEIAEVRKEPCMAGPDGREVVRGSYRHWELWCRCRWRQHALAAELHLTGMVLVLTAHDEGGVHGPAQQGQGHVPRRRAAVAVRVRLHHCARYIVSAGFCSRSHVVRRRRQQLLLERRRCMWRQQLHVNPLRKKNTNVQNKSEMPNIKFSGWQKQR